MRLSGEAQGGVYPRFASDGKARNTHSMAAFVVVLGSWEQCAGWWKSKYPSSLSDWHPLTRFWWGLSHQLWGLLFSARHTTQSSWGWCWQDRPPEHSSFRCHTTEICIFMRCAEEGSTWDFCTSLSPDVLTMLACQQAGALPCWEIKSTVITEVWHL